MLKKNVADRIHCVADSYVNWYIVEDDSGCTIVDAGLPTSWQSFEEALRELGRSPQDVKALVLTHGHFDHLGFAERLRREWGVPIYVHENDVPLTRHPRQYGRARPLSWYVLTQFRALPVIVAFLRNRAWWPRPIKEVHRYREGALAVPGSPRMLYTPGHTLGHCVLHFPDRDTVIAGDAVVTFNPYRGIHGPQIVSGAATADEERALTSLDVIAQTDARTVLVGHGEPWTEGAQRLVQLAKRRGPS